MTREDDDAAIFGEALPQVEEVRRNSTTAVEHAQKFFDIFWDPVGAEAIKNGTGVARVPAADLFLRKRYKDFVTVAMPGADDAFRYDLVAALLALDAKESNDSTSLYAVLSHAEEDDRLNQYVVLREAGEWSKLVELIFPNASVEQRIDLARHGKQVYDFSGSNDDRIAEIDEDLSRGALTAGEAVDAVGVMYFDGPHPDRHLNFVTHACLKLLNELVPSGAKQHDWVQHATKALERLIAQHGETKVYTVTQKEMVQPPPPDDEMAEKQMWATAEQFTEKFAKLVKPLLTAGLSSEVAAQWADRALRAAKDDHREHVLAVKREGAIPSSAMTSLYGHSLIGGNDD